MTGVKHLHQKAIEYDIGLYFEANGHGTVLFSRKAMLTFKTVEEDDKQSDIVREAARKLLALTKLINQTVGDAISDLLLVEVVLLNRGVSHPPIDDQKHSLSLCSGGVWSGITFIRNFLTVS